MPLRIVFYTDVHLRDNPPPSRRDDYRDSIFKKLEFMAQVASKTTPGIKTVTVCGGDMMDIKKWTQNSYGLVIGLMKIMKSTGCPNFILDGNHDLLADKETSLDSQPIGAVLHSGYAELLRDTGDLGGVVIRGFPFEEVPDFSKLQLSKEDLALQATGVKFVIVIHQYFSEKAGAIHGTPIYSYDEVAKYGYDLYLFGHYHVDQGVFVNDRDQTFVNIGSLSRGGYGDDALSRIPKIASITIDQEITVETLSVPCLPGDAIFDLEVKEMEKTHNTKLDEFITTLQASTLMGGTEATTSVDKELDKLGEGLTGDDLVVLEKVKEFLRLAAEELRK